MRELSNTENTLIAKGLKLLLENSTMRISMEQTNNTKGNKLKYLLQENEKIRELITLFNEEKSTIMEKRIFKIGDLVYINNESFEIVDWFSSNDNDNFIYKLSDGNLYIADPEDKNQLVPYKF